MPGLNAIANNFPIERATASEKNATIRQDGDARIRETTREFEAVILSLLLKDLRQSDEPDGLFAGDSGDVLGGLFDQLMGQHLAAGSGVGLAEDLLRPLRAYDTTKRLTPGYGHDTLADVAPRAPR